MFPRLLHKAGVCKVKRGPRKRQVFYYFPIRPVIGSVTEQIFRKEARNRGKKSSIPVLYNRKIRVSRKEKRINVSNVIDDVASGFLRRDLEGSLYIDFENRIDISRDIKPRRLLTKEEILQHSRNVAKVVDQVATGSLGRRVYKKPDGKILKALRVHNRSLNSPSNLVISSRRKIAKSIEKTILRFSSESNNYCKSEVNYSVDNSIENTISQFRSRSNIYKCEVDSNSIEDTIFQFSSGSNSCKSEVDTNITNSIENTISQFSSGSNSCKSEVDTNITNSIENTISQFSSRSNSCKSEVNSNIANSIEKTISRCMSSSSNYSKSSKVSNYCKDRRVNSNVAVSIERAISSFRSGSNNRCEGSEVNR